MRQHSWNPSRQISPRRYIQENVKCYRNIQDLFNEFDSKIEKMDEMEQGVGSVKGYVKCLSWFAILNFVVLIGFILYSLGVFNF